MKKSNFEIGTDEAAVKLGLTPRSVRRLGEKGILEGRIEITSVGKQWFFKKESLESLIKAREEQRQKQERHRTTQETLGSPQGQPQMTEDTTEHVRKPPMPNEKRVEFLEKLLEQERKEHAKTKDKLEQKDEQLIGEAKKAARLEGEKIGYEKYAVRMEHQQKQLIAMLRDTLPKLQSTKAGDDIGRITEDDQGRVRTTEDMSEANPNPILKNQNEEKEITVEPINPSLSHQNRHSEELIHQNEELPSKETKTSTE